MDEEGQGEDWQGGEEFQGGQEGEDDPGPCAKMGNSFIMCCVGIFCFPLALFVLGWNENHYVCKNEKILFAESKAVEIDSCSSKDISDKFVFFSCPLVDASLKDFRPCAFNEGMACAEPAIPPPAPAPPVVFATTTNATTNVTRGRRLLNRRLVALPPIPISFKSAAGRQRIEMFQCQEKCESIKKDKKTYKNCKYSMAWGQSTEVPFDQSQWERLRTDGPSPAQPSYINQFCPNWMLANQMNPAEPTNVKLGEKIVHAQTVEVGEGNTFQLNHELVKLLPADTIVELKSQSQGGAVLDEAYARLTLPSTGQPINTWARPFEISIDSLHIGINELTTCFVPTLGCVRIKYYKSSAQYPSVLTHVTSGGVTEPQKVKGSWGCSASEWQEITVGTGTGVRQKMTKEVMIVQLKQSNTAVTWALRICGLLFAWLAMYCCFSPISAAADVMGDCLDMIPCCGGMLENLLEGIAQTIICFMSCGIGCSCGLFVIAIVWVVMRPLYGGIMLGVCVCLCGCVFVVRSQATKQGKHTKANLGEGPPVSDDVAREFIDALTEEYVDGNEGKVGEFFDNEPDAAPLLQKFEDQVRDAEDPGKAVKALKRQWF